MTLFDRGTSEDAVTLYGRNTASVSWSKLGPQAEIGAGAGAVGAAASAAYFEASSAGASEVATGVSRLEFEALARGGKGDDGGGPSVDCTTGCGGDCDEDGEVSGTGGGKVYTASVIVCYIIHYWSVGMIVDIAWHIKCQCI